MFLFFLFNDTATTEIYTLSLHDALPIYFTESGEDEIVLCRSCGYAANMEKAEARIPEASKEDPLPLERVDTPGVSTIPDLSRFLHIPEKIGRAHV